MPRQSAAIRASNCGDRADGRWSVCASRPGSRRARWRRRRRAGEIAVVEPAGVLVEDALVDCAGAAALVD
jgi:hypothetical protein